MRPKALSASSFHSPWSWILAVLCLLSLGACYGGESPPADTENGTEVGTEPGPQSSPAVRLKFQDFAQDEARLASLRKAVAVMKSRNTASPDSADYRRSWEYWSAMHGYYGPQAKSGLLQDAIDQAPASRKQFYQGLRDLTYPPQPAGMAAEVWDMCTHGDPQFLTWHRMYLFFFEKILQEASGDPGLRLPYWDYTDPNQLQLPAAFASATLPDGNANSLYDNRRRSQTVALASQRTDIDDLLQQMVFDDFSGELEQQPHGYVHCTVGPGCPYPLMGDVPVAATDPIFWLHHANIDRIFQCWLTGGGEPPDDPAYLDQEYSFVDPTGALVKMTVRDLLSPTSPIDYTYDNVDNCSRQPPPPSPPTLEAPGPETVTPVARIEGLTIDDAVESRALAVPDSGSAADSLLRSLEAPAGAGRTELVLENIAVTAPPGVLFDVFLTTTGANARREYVGTITFFEVGRPKGQSGHAGHGTIRRRTFDVTDELQALKGTGELPDVEVVFEATLGPASSTLEAARPLFNRQAGLKVGTIHLRVKGEQQ